MQKNMELVTACDRVIQGKLHGQVYRVFCRIHETSSYYSPNERE